MALPAAACPKAPYGLSFTLKDLLYIRSWAERGGLRMEVLLDQVMEGAEFEELLLLRRANAGRRALSIWHTSEGIIAQAAGGQPKLFSGAQPVTVHYATYFASNAPARPAYARPALARAALARPALARHAFASPSFWRHLLLGG
jgi:hypothetical protein